MPPTPQDPITIRQAIVADASAVRELRLQALQNEPTAFGSEYEREAAWELAMWEERLSRPTAATFIAESVGAMPSGNWSQPAGTPALREEAAPLLVGLAAVGHEDRTKTRHNAGIYSVYVRPAWRGQGIAGQLLAACCGWARGRGLRLVKLAVVTTNLPAICAYQKAGFRVYGVDPQVIYYAGVYYDELLMAREL